VVIDDLDIMGVTVPPSEADSPSIVDPNAVLPSATTRQLLEAVARWNTQVRQLISSVEYQ
jgi:hypothetical protein